MPPKMIDEQFDDIIRNVRNKNSKYHAAILDTLFSEVG